MSDQINKKIYGPILPDHINNKSHLGDNDDDDDNESDGEFYGPILPLLSSKIAIGPNLPETIFKNPKNDETNSDDDDDDTVIGPLPEGEIDVNHVHSHPRPIEKETIGSKREKWMLEPPTTLSKTLPTKSVTKFNQRTTKEKPLTEKEKLEIQDIKEKEQRMNEFLEKYEKYNKRTVSLLETHREEMKKNKKTKATNVKRKEFDRERDLCAPRMDSKMKKSLINEASKTFGTRFSSGKFEKFL